MKTRLGEGQYLKLLSFFFENPGETFVMSQLHRRMNDEKGKMSYATVWKWVKAFVREGFVQEEGRGFKLHVEKCKHCYFHYRVILNKLAGL